MMVETTKEIDSQTGKIRSITLRWKETNDEKQLVLGLVKLFLILPPLGGVLFSWFSYPYKGIERDLTPILFMVAVTATLLQFLINTLRKGFRIIKHERSLTINADGSLYAGLGIPFKRKPRGLGFEIFAWWLVFVVVLLSNVFSKGTPTIYFSAIFIIALSFLYIFYNSFSLFKKDPPEFYNTRSEEIDGIQIHRASDWVGGYNVHGSVIALIKKDGNSVFVSHSKFAMAHINPVTVALSHAFKEMKRPISEYKSEKQ